MKRIITEKIAEERTYQKLNRDLDILPAGHADRGRLQQELAAVKAGMAARRGG